MAHRWTPALVRVLLKGKGVNQLSPTEKELYQKLPETYLSNLRRAVFRRLLGFHNLEKLAEMFRVDQDDLRAVVCLLFRPSLKDLRVWAFHFALRATLRFGRIQPLHYYERLTASIVQRALNLRTIRHRAQFLYRYDPGLTAEDLAGEVQITVLQAVQRNVGLSEPERLLHYASRTARNALVNVLKKYTTQKRARLRASDDPNREYEATVVSLPTATPSEAWDATASWGVCCGPDLTYDPILLARARRYFLARERFAWRKVRFLDLLGEGYTWEQAAAMVELSAVSQWRVRQVIYELLQREEDGAAALTAWGEGG